MRIEELMAHVNEEGISDEEKKKRLKELQELVKANNQMHDDHGPAILGHRAKKPKFSKD